MKSMHGALTLNSASTVTNQILNVLDNTVSAYDCFLEYGSNVFLGLARHARYKLGGRDLEQWQRQLLQQLRGLIV